MSALATERTGVFPPGHGWHRDHAREALRRAAERPPVPRRPREPVVKFGPEALRYCWAVLDGLSGMRLASALPRLVASLRAHEELVIDDTTAGLPLILVASRS